MIDRQQASRLFSANPVIHAILKDSETLQIARNFLTAYSEELSRFLHHAAVRQKSLEFDVQLSCLKVFLSVISLRSERLTRYSLLKQLWLLANGRYDETAADLGEAFIEDMYHLLLGLRGRSSIYQSAQVPKFSGLKKREAALERSKELDAMAASSASYIQRYRTGLDSTVIVRRAENKRRILAALKAGEAEWNDFRWQMRHVIRTGDQLAQLIELTQEERRAVDLARANKIPFGITPYYVSLMDFEPHRRDCLYRQVSRV